MREIKHSNEGGKPEYQGGDMATGPWEQLEQSEEHPDFVKELLTQEEGIHNHLKEHKKKDAKIPASQEDVNGSTNGLEEDQKDTLHIVDKDLDEFVDSMSEVTPSGLPKKSPEVEKHLLTEMAAAKLPRAEQVAEKVLRAERVIERAQRVEKPPVLEKVMEKVPRVEKMEKAVRVEKTAEKPHLAAPKFVSVKRKTESRAAKDALPWESLSLNKCILVATFLALLSVSCQVVQEVIEYGGAVLEAELSAWTTQESSPGEQEQLWFYERWFDWSDMDEPPDIEEEELLEVEEELLEVEEEEKEEAEETLEDGEDGEEETEPVEIEEEDEEEEEEEETEKKPAPKLGLRKIQEKIKRETPSKNKSRKDRKAQEEDEEKKDLRDKRHRWEGKGKEKQEEDRKKTHRHKHSEAAHPLKEPKEEHPSPDKRKGHPKDERGKGKGHLKHEKDPKGRKPWQIQKPFFPPPKDSGKTFGRHKTQEWKRHD